MTTETKPAVPVVYVTQAVPLERVAGLLCSAFEGGSNYWYMIEKHVRPPTLNVRIDPKEVFPHCDFPVNEGGALMVSDAKAADPEKVRTERLDLKAIKKGLAVMATKYPRHFGNFMAENDDAETGDVFLQCCLFGELVYG